LFLGLHISIYTVFVVRSEIHFQEGPSATNCISPEFLMHFSQISMEMLFLHQIETINERHTPNREEGTRQARN
jgi:hypothetical protein